MASECWIDDMNDSEMNLGKKILFHSSTYLKSCYITNSLARMHRWWRFNINICKRK